jgi:hypothetical protein
VLSVFSRTFILGGGREKKTMSDEMRYIGALQHQHQPPPPPQPLQPPPLAQPSQPQPQVLGAAATLRTPTDAEVATIFDPSTGRCEWRVRRDQCELTSGHGAEIVGRRVTV